MKEFLFTVATIIAIIAGYFIWIALNMDITVANPDGIPQRVVNIELQHINQIDFMLGIGAAVVSSIFYSASAIVSAIVSVREPNVTP